MFACITTRTAQLSTVQHSTAAFVFCRVFYVRTTCFRFIYTHACAGGMLPLCSGSPSVCVHVAVINGAWWVGALNVNSVDSYHGGEGGGGGGGEFPSVVLQDLWSVVVRTCPPFVGSNRHFLPTRVCVLSRTPRLPGALVARFTNDGVYVVCFGSSSREYQACKWPLECFQPARLKCRAFCVSRAGVRLVLQ